MFKNILVAVDLEHDSDLDNLLRITSGIAKIQTAKVNLLHVISAAPAVVSQFLPESYETMASEKVEQDLIIVASHKPNVGDCQLGGEPAPRGFARRGAHQGGGCIIDAIACAIPGSRADGARRIHSVAKSTFGKGDAVVWFGTERLHPTGAAFANAASASILDIDDGHRRALGHTGNRSGLGAAVTAGLSLGLTADQLMNALAITAYHGPRVADLTLSQDMGANVKESIPWSVVAGMMATDLAAQGFSGYRNGLDIEERFAPTVALDGLDAGYFPASAEGRTSHAVLRTYFKRYACCRWINSAVEGLLEIMRERNLSPEEILEIRVETFLQAASLDNLADPPTLESAQYSVPYCMGVAAALGENALMPLSADSLHHPPAIELANKITVQWVEEMDPDFPAKNPTRVIVTTAGGTFDLLLSVPWGEPDRPPDRADLVGKFHSLARDRIPEAQVANIVTAVDGLRDGMAQPLLDALAGC